MRISADLGRALPKVSPHCHLIRSARATTLVEWARKHSVALAGGGDASNLFDHATYADLDEFLRMLDVAGSIIRHVDDFRQITPSRSSKAAPGTTCTIARSP